MQTDDEVKSNDRLEQTTKSVEGQPKREKYIVVNPLFKNGEEIKKGETVLLDAHTAANFLNAGDIKKEQS